MQDLLKHFPNVTHKTNDLACIIPVSINIWYDLETVKNIYSYLVYYDLIIVPLDTLDACSSHGHIPKTNNEHLSTKILKISKMNSCWILWTDFRQMIDFLLNFRTPHILVIDDSWKFRKKPIRWIYLLEKGTSNLYHLFIAVVNHKHHYRVPGLWSTQLRNCRKILLDMNSTFAFNIDLLFNSEVTFLDKYFRKIS